MFILDQSHIQENILVISFHPDVAGTAMLVRGLRNLALETDHIHTARGGKLCRILDFGCVHVPYIVLVMLFAEESRFLRGTLTDPGLSHLIVARNKSVLCDIEHFVQRYQLQVRIMSDLDAAYRDAYATLWDVPHGITISKEYDSQLTRIG